MLEQEPVQGEDELGMLAREDGAEAELATPPVGLRVERQRGGRIRPVGERDPLGEISERIRLRLEGLERDREPVREELDVRRARRPTGNRG